MRLRLIPVGIMQTVQIITAATAAHVILVMCGRGPDARVSDQNSSITLICTPSTVYIDTFKQGSIQRKC